MMQLDADVAIIGSGFAGSLTAAALARRGRRVVMVERGRHPRFAIGESSTPLANLILDDLAVRYDLPAIRPLTKWGTWRRARPDLAVGLKRGFTFLFHRPGEPFADGPDHARQLLVAASPRDEIADTHWFRADFDAALAREAEGAGVVHLEDTRLEAFHDDATGVRLEGTQRGRPVRIAAGFAVDASGPRGFLCRALDLEAPMRWLPRTQGLYTHFEEVERWERLNPADAAPPYALDAAALHHVFPGGWIWLLRFNTGIVSAGAALTAPLAEAIRAADGAAAWDRLLATLPSVADQFRAARPIRPFVHAPRIACRTREVCGPAWALLPSAAGVVDPLLSTGIPLTLLGIERLLHVLESTSPGAEREAALRGYAQATQDELDVTEQLVAALYETMADPPLFKRLTRLYFAAASYAEAARRLGRSELAPGFLLHADPRFGPELRACAAMVVASPRGEARQALFDRIDRAIEPLDIAGLLDRGRHDWHPVLAEDLVAGAAKLDATGEEIQELLARTGWFGRVSP
jgi:FADH2 O2-dependent halogenase